MARHLFFGANTPEGFTHTFGDILFLDEISKMLYLKGSSGSGKSTLMRKIGAAFERLGDRVDYIHCTNNVEDLDGICVRERGIAMVDATAPHACDPLLPVAADEIYNTADFIGDSVAQHVDRLRELHRQKKPYYDKAYAYLNAACTVLGNNAYLYRQARNNPQLNRAVEQELAQMAALPIADKPGRNRRMFAGAITPQGNINFIGTLVEGLRAIALIGCAGMGTDLLLERLRQQANLSGFDTEGLYCPVNPRRLDHLLIPELGLCYVTFNSFHDMEVPVERSVDFEEFLDLRFLRERESELSYNRTLYGELLQRSMDTMAAQKEVHDQMERIYASSMDFEGLDRAFSEIFDRLLKAARD